MLYDHGLVWIKTYGKVFYLNSCEVTYLGFVGSLLQFWLEKKELKSSAFLKSVIKRYSWNKCGIGGIFVLFRKIFNKDY